MTIKPYPSRTKLCQTAKDAGHIVTYEDGKTVIDSGSEQISFAEQGDMTNSKNEVVSGEDAFAALGLELK